MKQVSVAEVLNRQKQFTEKVESEREQRVLIQKEADFENLIHSEIEDLSISIRYSDEKIPSLKPFSNLKRFSCIYPLASDEIAELDMRKLCELYFLNADSDSDIAITAPVLEKLTVHNRYDAEIATPLEKMLKGVTPHLHISAPGLKYLELSYFEGYDISSVGKLDNLEVLVIKNTDFADFSWLKQCRNLKKLHIYSKLYDIGDIPGIESLEELYLDYTGIESLDQINLFPSLRVLSLRGNKICAVKNPEKLNHIQRVDLSRNPISEKGGCIELRVSELILTDADREMYQFDSKIENVFRMAYRIYLSREKNIDELSPYMKRTWMNKSEEEKFSELVDIEFKNSFYSYNPSSYMIEYDTKVKRGYLDFVSEKYPFISIEEEFEKQIQRETLGIAHFHKEEPGNVIYANQSLYIIRVKREAGGNGAEARFLNTGYQKFKNEYIEKLIRENCPEIDISSSKVMLVVFDLYRTGKLDGVEIGILAALHSLEKNLSLPAGTFVSGEYKKEGQFKRLKVLSRTIHLANMHNADRIVFFTSGKQEQIQTGNIKIEYCNDMSTL